MNQPAFGSGDHQGALERSPQAPLTARTGSYGSFARWLLGWLFAPVQFPPESVPPLRALADKATLVYVLRASSLLQLLYFNFAFHHLGLPIARAATGLGYRIFAPFARWYLGGKQVQAPPGTKTDKNAAAVVEAVRQGESALVFLRSPRTLGSAVATIADPFPGLAHLQAELLPGGRRIVLVPLTLLWRRRPKQLSRSLRDVLFGDPEEPGAIRAAIGFLLHRNTSMVRVGTPVELAEELARRDSARVGGAPESDAEAPSEAGAPAPESRPAALEAPKSDPPRSAEAKRIELDRRVARRVRGFLHQHLSRESRVITGPPLKRPERVADSHPPRSPPAPHPGRDRPRARPRRRQRRAARSAPRPARDRRPLQRRRRRRAQAPPAPHLQPHLRRGRRRGERHQDAPGSGRQGAADPLPLP